MTPEQDQHRGPRLVTADGEEVHPEAFTDWIAEYPKGLLGLELSEAMLECINATRLHGKRSIMTFRVEFAQGNQIFEQIDVTTQVTTKPAKPKAPTASFFPTADGSLSRRDPNQPQIPGTEET